MGTIVTGHDTPTTANGFAPPTPEERRVTDALYDRNTTPAPTDASGFYGYPMLTSAIERRGADLWAATGASAADQARLRNDFVDIARTTRLPEPLVAALAEHHINQQLAEARPADDAEAAGLALKTQIAEWNTEARAHLRSAYGAKEAEALLARAQRFVKGHPALSKMLATGGVGSRPDVVQAIVSHVFSNGIR
jgi:hypothetical protein